MDKFTMLEKSMCHELETIEQKLQGGSEMSIQDLEKTDKLAHALKSLATYKAMKEADEYSEGMQMKGTSGANRYHGMNGRFVSHTGNSYNDGYSEGYSEAMNQMNGNSGHYPAGYPEYGRRW